MRFLPADEEFQLRTLAALGGCFQRPIYVAGLRRGDGQYHHWGFVRSYGQRTAHRIIQKQHELLSTEALRTPIYSLWKELLEGTLAGSTDLRELQAEFQALDLRPPATGPAESQHLQSVTIAMRELLSAHLASA